MKKSLGAILFFVAVAVLGVLVLNKEYHLTRYLKQFMAQFPSGVNSAVESGTISFILPSSTEEDSPESAISSGPPVPKTDDPTFQWVPCTPEDSERKDI